MSERFVPKPYNLEEDVERLKQKFRDMGLWHDGTDYCRLYVSLSLAMRMAYDMGWREARMAAAAKESSG